jgi:hypothetical protein
VSDPLLSELLTSRQVAELLSPKLGRHRRFVRSDVEAALSLLRDHSRR